jgi:hypothetical protein
MNNFDNLILKEYDLQLISFDFILEKTINDWINELVKLNLIQISNYKHLISFKDQDVKRLLLHCLTLNICNGVINQKNKFKKIIFVQPNLINCKIELFNYCNCQDFTNYINHILSKLNKLLPVVIYKSKIPIDFKNYTLLIGMLKGSFEETINNMLINYQKQGQQIFSYKKLFKFVSKYKLKFLDKEYFSKIENLYRLSTNS